ncbi:hypothetical protein HK102_004287, partial [Quaeritorhiza haematococci]
VPEYDSATSEHQEETPPPPPRSVEDLASVNEISTHDSDTPSLRQQSLDSTDSVSLVTPADSSTSAADSIPPPAVEPTPVDVATSTVTSDGNNQMVEEEEDDETEKTRRIMAAARVVRELTYEELERRESVAAFVYLTASILQNLSGGPRVNA